MLAKWSYWLKFISLNLILAIGIVDWHLVMIMKDNISVSYIKYDQCLQKERSLSLNSTDGKKSQSAAKIKG